MKQDTLLQHFFEAGHRSRCVRWSTGLLSRLSRTEFHMMNILLWHERENPTSEGIYASELAAYMHISRPAVSRQLQQLEERGLIVRTTDPDRKRNTFVRMTDAGRAVLEEELRKGHEFFTRVFHRVGEDRVELMLTICDELTAAMEDELKQIGTQSEGGEQ